MVSRKVFVNLVTINNIYQCFQRFIKGKTTNWEKYVKIHKNWLNYVGIPGIWASKYNYISLVLHWRNVEPASLLAQWLFQFSPKFEDSKKKKISTTLSVIAFRELVATQLLTQLYVSEAPLQKFSKQSAASFPFSLAMIKELFLVDLAAIEKHEIPSSWLHTPKASYWVQHQEDVSICAPATHPQPFFYRGNPGEKHSLLIAQR